MNIHDIVERLRKNVTEMNKRPLLEGINPEKRLAEILKQREAMYKLVRCMYVHLYCSSYI